MNSPDTPEGFVLAPRFRGYANLGIGAYLLNHSASGNPAELVISIATDEEKAGRVVGDERGNPDGHEIQPEVIAVRLRFENVAGLDALEKQLRYLREVHFPGTEAQPVGEVVIGEEGMTKGWTVIKWRADLPPVAAGTKLYATPVSRAQSTPKPADVRTNSDPF